MRKPSVARIVAAIHEGLGEDLGPIARRYLLELLGQYEKPTGTPETPEAREREKRRIYMAEYRRRTPRRHERSLVSLFDEVTALARDEALDDAERGRRLVDLLGTSDVSRVRLTHLYGKKLAGDIIATIRELGPWRLHWPARQTEAVTSP